MIKDLNKEINLDKNKIKELFNLSLNKANKYQSTYNSFVTLCDEMNYTESQSLLNGIPYALKDNISTSNILTTASSNILSNYVPVYDATIYKKLKNSGAILLGKTVMDELAMGGSGTTGHTGIVKNPWDSTRIIGGSSAGSAAAVALGIVPFSIGSDTGDSVRKPACYGGVVGFKPTYGRISRYGLFPFASSLDHIGIFAKSVEDVAIVTDVLKGHDEKDMTSLPDENIKYADEINNNISSKKLFYIDEVVNIETNDEEIQENLDKFKKLVNKLESLGIIVEKVSVDRKLLDALLGTYFSISCAEATSNNSNLTGIHFGKRIDGEDYQSIMRNSRTSGFCELIKRRFVLGSYILKRENQEKLYLNALRIRRLIVEKFNSLFEIYDGMLLPASGKVAPKIGKSNKEELLTEEYKILENHLVIGNFGGYPSITIPAYLINNMPMGVNITCGVFKDSLTLNIASKIEKIINFTEECDKNV